MILMQKGSVRNKFVFPGKYVVVAQKVASLCDHWRHGSVKSCPAQLGSFPSNSKLRF